MDVVVRIKNKGLVVKKLNLNEVLEIVSLQYGSLDKYFRLVKNKIEDKVICYEKNNIGRGIHLECKKGYIYLKLLMPTSKREIGLYYTLIEDICKKINKKSFIKNNHKVNIKSIEKEAKKDVITCEKLIENMYMQNKNNNNEVYKILQVTNPIYLGKNEFEYINNDLENFEALLNAKQNLDSYYSISEKINKNGLNGRVYTIKENTNSIIPNINRMNEIHKQEEIYFNINDNYIKYENLISNIDEVTYYDANNIKLSLDDNKVNELIKNFKTEM